MMTNFLRCWLLSGLLIAMASPLGAASPTEQPIELSADRGEVDYNRKVSVYQGNVILKQANMEIRGDELKLFFTQDNALLKMSIQGKPASFEQTPEPKARGSQASALKTKANLIDYELRPVRKLILTGDAELWQGQNRFNGERIEYDFETDIVRANSGASSKSRVNVTIYQQPSASLPQSGEESAP